MSQISFKYTRGSMLAAVSMPLTMPPTSPSEAMSTPVRVKPGIGVRLRRWSQVKRCGLARIARPRSDLLRRQPTDRGAHAKQRALQSKKRHTSARTHAPASSTSWRTPGARSGPMSARKARSLSFASRFASTSALRATRPC